MVSGFATKVPSVVHRQIEADKAGDKLPKRKAVPADYIARRSLNLPESARYEQAAMSVAPICRSSLPGQ
jgi:hypothetical protein